MGNLHNGTLLAVKKKKILPFATIWMDMENIVLSELSQSEKDKCHMIYSHVESNEQTELTRKIRTDLQTESRVTAKGNGDFRGRGMKEKGHMDMDNSVVIVVGKRE